MKRTLMLLGAVGSLMLLGGCASDYYERDHYRGGGTYNDGDYYSSEYGPNYYPYAYDTGPNGRVYAPYGRQHDGYRRDGDHRDYNRGDHRGDGDRRGGDRGDNHQGNRDQTNTNQANANQGNTNNQGSGYRNGGGGSNGGNRGGDGGGHWQGNSGSGSQSQPSTPPADGGPSGRFGHPGSSTNPL